MKTILMTGGHGDIGLVAVKELIRRGHLHLILAGRDEGKIKEIVSKIELKPDTKIDTIQMDVSSIESVESAAKKILQQIQSRTIGPLDAIICNAGLQYRSRQTYTLDGFETTFATNYLGHYLLTKALEDGMAKDGRFIYTSSGTHNPETMDGKMVGIAAEPNAMNLANDGKSGFPSISGGQRYATSKLCLIMMSYELDRKLKAQGSQRASIAFDPGFIPETGLARQVPSPVRKLLASGLMKWVSRKLGVTMGDLKSSGRFLAEVAVDVNWAQASGKFLQSKDGMLSEVRSSKISYNTDLQKKLWNDSEILIRRVPGAKRGETSEDRSASYLGSQAAN